MIIKAVEQELQVRFEPSAVHGVEYADTAVPEDVASAVEVHEIP